MVGRLVEGQLNLGSINDRETPKAIIRVGVNLDRLGRAVRVGGDKNSQFKRVPPIIAADDNRIIGSGENIVSSLREEEAGVNFGAHSVAMRRRIEYTVVKAVAIRSKMIAKVFFEENRDVSMAVSFE